MNDDESHSKDVFFQQIAEISNAMIEAHGKDFAIGAFVLAARFIAERLAAEQAPAAEPASSPIITSPTPA